MIKKISSILIFLLLVPNLVFAEALLLAQPSIQIKEKTNIGLEDFFQKIQNQDFESAYKIMSDDFIKNTPFDDFKLILLETGLTTFNQKTWTSSKETMLGVLVMIKGDFSAPNGQIHHLEFDIFNDAHNIKIRNISENITLQDLKKRFPPRENLQTTVEKDLRVVTDFLQQKNANGLYGYLAPNSQNQVSKTNIRKMLAALKKSKLTVEVPENAVVVLQKMPHLSRNGSMRVRGDYQNSKAKIHFALDYNYQWQWKLGNFRFDLRPLDKIRK